MGKQKHVHVHPEHPHREQLMIAASDYYRKRADVDRGLKKRDMPSADLPDTSEKVREKAADPEVAPSNP